MWTQTCISKDIPQNRKYIYHPRWKSLEGSLSIMCIIHTLSAKWSLELEDSCSWKSRKMVGEGFLGQHFNKRKAIFYEITWGWKFCSENGCFSAIVNSWKRVVHMNDHIQTIIFVVSVTPQKCKYRLIGLWEEENLPREVFENAYFMGNGWKNGRCSESRNFPTIKTISYIHIYLYIELIFFTMAVFRAFNVREVEGR